MDAFRRNHYVPRWYQERFFPKDVVERKFYLLDKNPGLVERGSRRIPRKAILRWGTKHCFCEQDLYTTRFDQIESTEIEEKFFGPVDASGIAAVEYLSAFSHPSVNSKAYQDLVRYMSLQKLRTPKGLRNLASWVNEGDKNRLLIRLQQYQRLFAAIWTECVWSIVDASETKIGFLLTDHPVTVYNQGCFPESRWCREHNDPDIRLSGTHTLFPLNLTKLLVLTNLNWARNPYGDPIKGRPNPELQRHAMFNFLEIQTGRMLSENEVLVINFILKQRALRYVAAVKKEWLLPELKLAETRWDRLTQKHLLMPDPRSMTFSTSVIIGYKDNTSQAYDEYGFKPGQSGYDDKQRQQKEFDTFHGFKGEFARIYGPKRRGRTYEVGALSAEEDDPEYHQYHLGLEAKFKPTRKK